MIVEEGAMRIGDLARRAGVNPKTIRFYERLGLLNPEARTATGYRLYSDVSLRQLKAIRVAKEAGLSLAEIRELFPVLAGQEARCAEVLPVLERKRREVDDQIRRLEQLRDFLDRSTAICRRAQRTSPTVVCPVLSVPDVGRRNSREVP